MTGSERLEAAKKIAEEAGGLLMNYYGKIREFEHKGEIDFLTIADMESEKFIVNRIKTLFPEDAVVAEENGGFDGTSGFKWIIDPLDGTTNFLHSYPLFCVSIGIEKEGEVIDGVVFCPTMREMFYAEKGKGGFLNGGKIAVSAVESVSNSLVATGFPYNRRELVDGLLAKLRGVIMNAHGMRRSGVASFDLCSVASGRVDGFWEEGLKPWDVAAGSLIINEAGGRITDFSLGGFSIYGNEILASNGMIHEEFARVLFGKQE
ncbi:MAG: inositol monophosphatase [Deltaproteobacteria bacterium]|nr:inositol monophosphatase [Deltaproteobacteria bacterium]